MARQRPACRLEQRGPPPANDLSAESLTDTRPLGSASSVCRRWSRLRSSWWRSSSALNLASGLFPLWFHWPSIPMIADHPSLLQSEKAKEQGALTPTSHIKTAAASRPGAPRPTRPSGEFFAGAFDAAAGVLEEFGRGGVGDAEIGVHAERGAMDAGDAFAFQEIAAEIFAAGDGLTVGRGLADGAGAARVDVEGTLQARGSAGPAPGSAWQRPCRGAI